MDARATQPGAPKGPKPMRAAPCMAVGKAPWTALCIAFPLAGLAAAGRMQETEPGTPVRSFSIPDTRQGRALFERARQHVAARRFGEAIADLQSLIVDAPRRRARPAAAAPSASGSRSTSAWPRPRATRSWPCRARRARSTPSATPRRRGSALEAARRSADRRALIEVARRWPLTEAAVLAWWTLGDLELELGNPRAASDAWDRARHLGELAGTPPPAGADLRVRLLLEGDDGALEGMLGGTLGGPEAANALSPPASGASPPGPDGHSWRRPIDIGSSRVPFGPELARDLQPLPGAGGRHAARVQLAAPVRLRRLDRPRCAGAATSRRAGSWSTPTRCAPCATARSSTGPSFFDAIDRRSVLIAPAAAGGIAVAALQIPLTQLGNTRYQNIPITTRDPRPAPVRLRPRERARALEPHAAADLGRRDGLASPNACASPARR